MLFNSFAFFGFLLIAAPLILALRGRPQRLVLLLFSYLFYAGWNPLYLPLLLASSVVDFSVGLALKKRSERVHRNLLLALSLGFNLSLLLVGKSGILGDYPVGISFYTFQTLAYTIDVWRGRTEAQTDPLVFGLYVAYFPQLVAGPIERPANLMPQLERPITLRAGNVLAGSKRILWGLFQKTCLGDRLAELVDPVFARPDHFSALTLLLALLAFYGQIYWDFSGYCNIALGTSQLFGIRLSENFRRPYLSSNISEFWTRWHITLSQWFRDYVYISLGGNRVSRIRWSVNITAVFILSALWHGLGPTFVAWGALHTLYYLAYSTWRSQATRRNWSCHPALAWLLTFWAVSLAWVFFRASTVDSALLLIGRICRAAAGESIPLASAEAVVTSGLCVLALIAENTIIKNRRNLLSHLHRGWRWLFFLGLLIAVILWAPIEGAPFIYFQF